MTYFNSTMTAVAAAFILTASLSSANAWGDNDQYGKGQTSSQSSRQTDGYGGGQGRPTGSSRPSRTTDTYGTGSNSYPTRPCRRCREPWSDYNDRPSRHGTVYIPPRRDTYGDGGVYGSQSDYRPSRDTYVRPRRDSYGSGDTYGSGSRPSKSTNSGWDSSGGYGGRQ